METTGHLEVPVLNSQTCGLLNHLGISFLVIFELACGWGV